MFVHSVYFWLQNPGTQADQEALYAGLQTLKTIDVVSTAYIGQPAETRRPVIDHSYDFALILVFENKADHDTYQEHPTHLQFVSDCSHLWTRVQIYDSVG
jgi:hypothetical protein